MYSLQTNLKFIVGAFLLTTSFIHGTKAAYDTYAVEGSGTSFLEPTIVRERTKRDVPPPAAATAPATPLVPATPPPASTANATAAVNGTGGAAQAVAVAVAVTQTPLLGVNGSGILHVNNTNMPRVSEPLFPDDNITTDAFKETPEMMKAEQNITDLKYDTHDFYNSSFIGNVTYFNEYWANITKINLKVHPVLSNSHRRATTLRLSFPFPFYGHNLNNITIATGGFIYTGEQVHNWLAATQYIAPLMANFDTTLTNDSYVRMSDDGNTFTAIWENVTLQEDKSKTFTFAVTLDKSGDITFAYKDIPIAVQDIHDGDHPVKVGISDAYLTDRIMFLVRRKTIYEYHRVSFKNYEITNNTILKLTALPTCLPYNSCESCVNHDTGFDCTWCEAVQKCSSGTDRNKQDWVLRHCDKNPINNASMCPRAVPTGPGSVTDGRNTAYVTDSHLPNHPAVVNTINTPLATGTHAGAAGAGGPVQAPVSGAGGRGHSAMGGVVAACVAVALVCSLAAWALYAFKNPHTRSGQLLIKYRPSQWSWRRGEARYTAATIHM